MNITMENSSKIAAVYVTYNPSIELLRKSVDSVNPQVGHIIIVDNTDNSKIKAILKTFSNDQITIYDCEGNKGIAYGLNRGYELAINKGFDWVLSMDQDSIMPENTISTYTEYIDGNQNIKIGALMPALTICNGSNRIIGKEAEELSDYMTSGSLVSMNAFLNTKGFKEDWFIDLVDTEFGLQLLQNEYKIIRIPSVVMHHNIGNAKDVTVFGRHLFYITRHNWIRRYYISRNLFYLAQAYPSNPVYPNPNKQILKSLCRIIFFENDKFRKLKSVIRGIKDYRKGIKGQYNYFD